MVTESKVKEGMDRLIPLVWGPREINVSDRMSRERCFWSAGYGLEERHSKPSIPGNFRRKTKLSSFWGDGSWNPRQNSGLLQPFEGLVREVWTEKTRQLVQSPTGISLLFLCREQSKLFLLHCCFQDKISFHWAQWVDKTGHRPGVPRGVELEWVISAKNPQKCHEIPSPGSVQVMGVSQGL